jgi:hypothetical protein
MRLMTGVIPEPAPFAYAQTMQPSGNHPALAAWIRAQRALEERLNDRRMCPEDALVAGRALLAFADCEDEAFLGLAPLLDPAARQELVTEHHHIAEDLALLDSLLRTTPDSPDVAELTASLLRRMRQHLDRDARLLATATGLHPRT